MEDLLDSGHHISTVTVKDLYLFMGRELETLESVPAGNVLGMLEQKYYINPFIPKFLKWTLPSFNFVRTIVPNSGLSQKSKQNGKQCRAISSGSTLFEKDLFRSAGLEGLTKYLDTSVTPNHTCLKICSISLTQSWV